MENYDTKKEQRKENSGEEIDLDNHQQGVGAISLNELPEGCIAEILSATTPADVCRFSRLSSTFRSAAASDSVWFYQHHVLIRLTPLPSLSPPRNTCFSIFLIILSLLMKAKRFKEVAKLNHVWWLEIRGKISTYKLSLHTNYAAYLVFKLRYAFGFDYHPVEVSLTLGVDKICTKSVILEPRIVSWPCRRQQRRRHERFWCVPEVVYHSEMSSLEFSKERADGWLEIEIGDFFNRYGQDELEISVMEVKAGIPKGGLVVHGVEIRPKDNKLGNA
ncbi:putative F-box protein PP2-B8 [Durio zibethinus]|uniref:F-box protein PP2-B8 n=1 Tax=Durio zibethinus TaxID=66656 RepID=A0A6P5ZPA9_DURZI|nr:putative F-box protein PP2-B8 [Durio zibethinus]